MTNLDPEDITLLRVKFRVEYEFVAERNALTGEKPHTRQDVREAVQRLTQAERRALQSRVRQRLCDVGGLMDGEPKRFDEARAKPTDLERSCRFDTV